MVNIRPGYGEIMARAKLKDIPVVNGGPSLYSFWRLRTTRPSLVPRDGKRVRRRRPRPHQFNSAMVRDGSLDGGADRRNRLVGRALPAPEPAPHDFIEVYGVPGESDFETVFRRLRRAGRWTACQWRRDLQSRRDQLVAVTALCATLNPPLPWR